MSERNDVRDHDVLISPRGVVGGLRAMLRREASPFEGAASDGPEDDALKEQIGTGLEEAVTLFEAQVDRGAVMFAPDHGPGSLLQAFLAETASGQFEDLLRGGKLDPSAGGEYEAKFDEHDLAGWAASLLSWWRRLLKKQPYLGPPETPDRIPDHARIAILGDWGSGRYGAPVSAATIASARPAYDMVLHLGDVYYAGTSKEVQQRFLDAWPKVPGALNRALNSNHEMYSGGQGYFGLTLPAFNQPASCFA